MKLSDIKFIDKKYRPVPFWSWNEKLSVTETKRQVALMDDAGIGGYFMHARGGLLTEYMGDEWFQNVKAAIDEGDSRGMHSWAYDENGWPSGFGGGLVSGLGEKYQQKSLHTEPVTEEGLNDSRNLLVRDGYRYYYTVNEFYVDVLDRAVTEKFVEKIHCEYKKRFSNGFDGFFTDEPQIYRGTGYPWSFTLEEKFSDRYGYSLIDSLDSLFSPVGDYRKVRVDYWQLVTELFSECFMKVIHDFCVSNGYGLTGHLVCEESFLSQLTSNGAAMPHYEYFTLPGMDWLGRPIRDCLTPMQLSSAAAQCGKKQILSETFALAGHNVSHGELKRIYEWQMVHGVNLLCPHLEGYSLRGIRKRDYPPAMYYQQPWWEDVGLFFDAMSRIGMLLAEGDIEVGTLLIHTQSSAWALYDGIERSKDCIAEIERYNRILLGDMRTLEDKHILYHLGDEIMMLRHARVEGNELVVGKMRYKNLIIPEHVLLLPHTERLIEEFRSAGGNVTTAEALEANPITSPSRLSYTKRIHDGFVMHYFVNSDNTSIEAEITEGDLVLDPVSGETSPFTGRHTFEPYESLVILDTGRGISAHEPRKTTTELSLFGEWKIKDVSFNSLTLDKCDYYFDGELIERDGYVLNIIPRLSSRRTPTRVKQVYRFRADCVSSEMFLAIETPSIFNITLNSKPVSTDDVGYFRDSAFRMLPIQNAVKEGINELVIESVIIQSDKTYSHLDNSWTFESMKNCLSYDMELEPVYIVGNFGVALPETAIELPLDSYRINSAPYIVSAPPCVDICHIDESGYPEFSGKMVLMREIELTDTNRSVRLCGRGMNSVSLSVNGKAVATKMFPPYDVDITDYLTPGVNTLEITILNNLRNMMGPHHLKIGESVSVSPRDFFKESNVFAHPTSNDPECHDILPWWDDGICLVHFGF